MTSHCCDTVFARAHLTAHQMWLLSRLAHSCRIYRDHPDAKLDICQRLSQKATAQMKDGLGSQEGACRECRRQCANSPLNAVREPLHLHGADVACKGSLKQQAASSIGALDQHHVSSMAQL